MSWRLVLPDDVWLTSMTASAATDPSSSTSSSTAAVDGVDRAVA